MSTKPEIKIEPSIYKGWGLSFTDSRQDKNFTGKRNGEYKFADSLKALLEQIDEAERIFVKFKKPIKCLWKDAYSCRFVPVQIHALCGETIYFRTDKGEEKTGFMPDLRPEQAKARGSMASIYIFDHAKNHRLLTRGVELKTKATELNKQAEELAGKVERITEADILVAAKAAKG
ncbi:MAG: hypothetical protein KGL39_19560 [Patescibacteria group bacterium]|nr:hypothetical protein [Patescibacteria group bacterium]